MSVMMMMMMSVQFHVSAPIERMEPAEEALQRVGLEKWVILGNAGYVNRKLIICNRNSRVTLDRTRPTLLRDYYWCR